MDGASLALQLKKPYAPRISDLSSPSSHNERLILQAHIAREWSSVTPDLQLQLRHKLRLTPELCAAANVRGSSLVTSFPIYLVCHKLLLLPMNTIDPVPLLELNVLHALGAILNKPRWWDKWGDAAVRARWLDEIQEQFVLATFGQTLVRWDQTEWLCEPVEAVFNLERGQTTVSNSELAKWLRGVVAHFRFSSYKPHDEYYEYYEYYIEFEREERAEEQGERKVNRSPEEVAAAKALATEKINARLVDARFERHESYAAVKWTLNQLALYEELQQIPFEQWHLEAAREAVSTAKAVAGDELNRRATDFVRQMLRDGVTQDTLQLALPVPNDPAVVDSHKQRLLLLHCERISKELKAVEAYIVQWMDQTLVQLDGQHDDTKIMPAGVPGTFISDNAIPPALATVFITQVSELENVPEDEKDWHPNSNKQVLDLVHPSLYCYVYGKTRQVPKSSVNHKEFSSPAEQMESIMLKASETIRGKKKRPLRPKFLWIPTDFVVRYDGTVRIASYINNLHPRKYAGLYDSISAITTAFLPMFERVVAAQREPWGPTFEHDSLHSHASCTQLPRRPTVPTQVQLPSSPDLVSLRSRSLQIIVKIAEIVLTPENPRYDGGAWHVEGTDAEAIVGTGLYYFGSDNITESRLAFRIQVNTPEHQQNDWHGMAAMYGLFNKELLMQEVGSVEAVEGRCLVFPNTHQHKVQPFELADPTKPGVRKILALFLVDPDKWIPSTSVIPPQQADWRAEMLEPLREVSGMTDTVESNIMSMVPGGMTLDEAKEHRLAFMKERTWLQDCRDGDEELHFNLCEH